jgi:ribosomal protein L32
MGAVPKNKITKVERGKRRAGNKPSLKKDAKHAITPAYKQGLVASIFKKIGLN